MNPSHISDTDQSSLSCCFLWFHPPADDQVILFVFKEPALECGWLLCQFARGKGESCLSEAAATLRNQRAGYTQPGIRDFGSFRARISRALAGTIPEPAAVATPPSPSPVRHSQFSYVTGQNWPYREGQMNTGPPSHMRSHEGMKPPLCPTGGWLL